MKKFLIILYALFLLACSLDKTDNKAQIGQKSIELSAKDTLDRAVKLADDKSPLKVLVFFRNGCASCLKELPFLDKFAQNYPNKISIYAINSLDSAEVVKALAKDFDFKNIKILKDDLKITNDRYFIFATPSTILIKDGVIKDRILGEIPCELLKSKLISLL